MIGHPFLDGLYFFGAVECGCHHPILRRKVDELEQAKYVPPTVPWRCIKLSPNLKRCFQVLRIEFLVGEENFLCTSLFSWMCFCWGRFFTDRTIFGHHLGEDFLVLFRSILCKSKYRISARLIYFIHFLDFFHKQTVQQLGFLLEY